LKTEAPLIGTGMETRAAIDTGDVLLADNNGSVSYVDAQRIVVEHGSKKDEYPLHKYMRSNQGTIIHQKPRVDVGDSVDAGQVLADGSSTDQGELALGKNCLVAFMSWEGYNFEDAIIISERLVKDDELTSIHIEEYEIDARTTKLGDEAQDRRGRQARGPPRQQGRDLEDRARGRHAAPGGRHPDRRHPEPARRAEPDEPGPDHGDPPRLGRRQRLVRRRFRRLQAVED